MMKTGVVCLMMFFANAAVAQWSARVQRLAPGIDAGALSYHRGDLWAGDSDLFLSTDTAVTWTSVAFPDRSGITDICFLNRDTGVVSTLNGLYQTFDRGQTWSDIAPNGWRYMRVAYNHSPLEIYALAGGEFYRSHDGGKTWTHNSVSKYGFAFALDRYGAIYFPDVQSSDLGRTWKSGGAFPASSTDAWSIGLDSCGADHQVVIAENYWVAADGMCRIVATTDHGTTWTTTFLHKKPDLAGALASGPSTMYAAALDRIMRSTDDGLHWNTLPGSPAGIGADTRSLCALSDNLILALDTNGTIWLTQNGGGQPVSTPIATGSGTVALSTHHLFQTDSIIACKDSLIQTVFVIGSGCNSPVPQSVNIEGSGSAEYFASLVTPGHIRVVFRPSKTGLQQATLIVGYDNGSQDSVSLTAVGSSNQKITITTADQRVDTLGAVIRVPFTLAGVPDTAAISFVLRYSGSVEYLGSYDANGDTLDIEALPRGSRLTLGPHDSSGYALFRIFNDSNITPTVSFDSISLPTVANADCMFSQSVATASIRVQVGCEQPYISEFLQTGSLPRFSIYPDPATAEINIESSSDEAAVHLKMVNAMGCMVLECNRDFVSNIPLTLPLSIPKGVYSLEIEQHGSRSVKRFVVE